MAHCTAVPTNKFVVCNPMVPKYFQVKIPMIFSNSSLQFLDTSTLTKLIALYNYGFAQSFCSYKRILKYLHTV